MAIRYPIIAILVWCSLAYFLRHLDADQERELMALVQHHLGELEGECELGAPEFCTFSDMFKFDRAFYLGDGTREVSS